MIFTCAATPEHASKQISAALTTLKDAADKALKAYSDETYRVPVPALRIKDVTTGTNSLPTPSPDLSQVGNNMAPSVSAAITASLVSASSMQLASWCLKLLPRQAAVLGGQLKEGASSAPPLTQDTLTVLNKQGEDTSVCVD
jgi:hypothetical protein